jgi:hypothetical protein
MNLTKILDSWQIDAEVVDDTENVFEAYIVENDESTPSQFTINFTKTLNDKIN